MTAEDPDPGAQTQPRSLMFSREEALKHQPLTITGEPFDIVSTYQSILASDPDLTKPVAAIEALIALLGATDSSTVFETLEVVRRAGERLKASVANSMPLRAGTDLFLHNLVVLLRNQQEEAASGPTGDRHATSVNAPPSQYPSFEDVRQHLLRNARMFASHALEARDRVAERGWRFVCVGDTVLTHGASRAVVGILARAAAELSRRCTPTVILSETPEGGGETKPREKDGMFSVIYVRDDFRPEESDRVVAELRGHGIAVAEIHMAAVAHVLSLRRKRVSMALLGAEAVTHDGGVISRMGTFQIARVARLRPRIPVRVAAETHKFVRNLPQGQADIGFRQQILDYHKGTDTGFTSDAGRDAVDYTPSEYITHLITEDGVTLPGYACELLLNQYGTLATH